MLAWVLGVPGPAASVIWKSHHAGQAIHHSHATGITSASKSTHGNISKPYTVPCMGRATAFWGGVARSCTWPWGLSAQVAAADGWQRQIPILSQGRHGRFWYHLQDHSFLNASLWKRNTLHQVLLLGTHCPPGKDPSKNAQRTYICVTRQHFHVRKMKWMKPVFFKKKKKHLYGRLH